MMINKTVAKISALVFLMSNVTGSAFASDTTQAWGTMSSSGANSRSQSSAALHRSEGENAQLVTIGNNVTSMYRTVTSCGFCVYNQITGNSNSIDGNTLNGTNSGTTTSTAEFGDTINRGK